MAEKNLDYTDEAVASWSGLRDDVDLSLFAVGMRIMRLSAALRSALDDAIASSGFTVLGDYEVLSVLRRAGEPTLPSDIASRLRMTRAGVTGRLIRLETAGLLRRDRSGDDSRNVLVSLTARGRKATDRAFDEIRTGRARRTAGNRAGMVSP